MNTLKGRNLNNIVYAYLVCALWSSSDDDGNPLDGMYEPGGASPETEKQAREDCENFLTLCDAGRVSLKDWDDAQIGHDFWLTRNHHGAGFWDRGRGRAGEEATKYAQTFSEVDVVQLTDEVFIIE